MYSFAFPNMLGSNQAKLVADLEAVRSNIKLVLSSERFSLFGDPYYGTRLKRMLFEQSSQIVADLVIDEIYTTLTTFIPQIYLTRKDIKVTLEGTDMYATVTYIYVPENVGDLYKIKLTTFDEEEAM